MQALHLQKLQKVEPSKFKKKMEFETPTTDTMVEKLIAIFGTALGVFLSRLIVNISPSKQAMVVNWLIAAGAAGLFAFIGGKGNWTTLTSTSLLGMVGDRTVTGVQSMLQNNQVVAMPQDAASLSVTKRIALAAVGYDVNSIQQGLASPGFDPSAWGNFKTIDAQAPMRQEMMQDAQTSVTGYAGKNSMPTGY